MRLRLVAPIPVWARPTSDQPLQPTSGTDVVPASNSVQTEFANFRSRLSGRALGRRGGQVKASIEMIRKVLVVGGWAPLLVFLIHVIASRVFQAYQVLPKTDIPMHVAGGLAMAFFVSRCFRALPREVVRSSRLVVLEVVLVGSLTTSAAVVWELAEFSLDQLVGSHFQVGLANTMQDMALGMLGAGVFIAARARQLRAGRADLRDVAVEWISGRAA
jgi:hypothetical protein